MSEIKLSPEPSIRWKDGDYEGDLEDGVPNGFGIIQYDTGDYYEGDFRRGIEHGDGYIRLADETRYRGDFKDGKIEGRGVQSKLGEIYDGEFKKSLYHGQGRLQLLDSAGRVLYEFEGHFKNGLPDGLCSEISPRYTYRGEWKNGEKNGRGELVFTHGPRNAREYVGTFKDGVPNGEGIETTNYYTYEGKWSRGLKSGKGVAIYANGDVYDGEWRDNKRHGLGEFYPSAVDNVVYKGHWENGLKSGKGVSYVKDRVYDEVWEQGRQVSGKQLPISSAVLHDDPLVVEAEAIDPYAPIAIFHSFAGGRRRSRCLTKTRSKKSNSLKCNSQLKQLKTRSQKRVNRIK